MILIRDVEDAIVLGLIPASSDTLESEGRLMKKCWIKYSQKNVKNTCKIRI
jgi:hypothetical protein